MSDKQPQFPEHPNPSDNVHSEEAKLVRWVAAAWEDTNEFTKRAKESASKLKEPQINNLPQFFYYKNNPRKPEAIKDEFGGLGEWQWMCQVAIFEIFYYCPKYSLPIIRKYAFGIYDWTQMHAINILCRLAQDNQVNRSHILNEMAEFLPKIDDRALTSAIYSLSLIKPNEQVVIDAIHKIFDEYCVNDPTHIDTELILELSRISIDEAKKYTKNLELISKLDRNLTQPNLEASYDSIQATIMLSTLYPDDSFYSNCLTIWAKQHQDERRRNALIEAFKSMNHINYGG